MSVALMFDPDALVGETLSGEWTVDSRVTPTAVQTGDNFSIGYLACNSSGRRGYVKVLNYEEAFRSVDPTAALQQMTEAYNFERDLVDRCGIHRLSRVVAAYCHGTVRIAAFPIPINYIVFEFAQFDIRRALDLSSDLDMAVKLRMCHNAASGLAQLHAIGVAHQDVKPSNLLVFDHSTSGLANSKIADLGRATDRNVAAWHDSFTIAGDPTYAPPEQRYGEVHSSFALRRLACDLYQLGNLIAFIVTGTTMNARLDMHLHPAYAPANWGGSYADVLAYVQAAHSLSLQDFAQSIDHPLGDRIVQIVSCLTDPDASRRGHPASHRARQPFAMNRIVTELDLLSRRAEASLGRRTQ